MATSNDPVASCLHGEWVDGTCVCERGYESIFNDAILDPVYCSDRIVRVLTKSIDPTVVVHYLTMSFTAALVASSTVSVLLSVFRIWCLHSLAKKIGELGQKLCDIHKETLRRDSRLDLTAKIWAPLSNFHVINVVDADKLTVNKATGEEPPYHYAKILHCYEPQTPGELCLHKVGEIITEVVSLEYGWCKGKLNGKEGFFPAAYVEMLN